MNDRAIPRGWPSPHEVGESVLTSGMVDGGTRVTSATLLTARPWSVIYAVDVESGSGERIRLAVKSIREPHHVRPAEGVNHRERLSLELETLTLARSRQIPMPKPYGLVEEFGALVMERVEERRIMSSGVPERQRIRAFVAIGRICRRWHEIDADVVEGAVVMSPDDITTAIRGDAARLGDFGLGPMKATWWPGILDELVPDDLDVALVATHGDLHLGNVLMTGSFDPLFVDAALVRAPAIHDVAHLSTSIRTSRAALTGGVANRLRVERRVSALMAGFGLHDRRLFALDELAIMLDQWSDVRTDLAMGQGRRVRAVGVRLADRLFSTELERWYDRVVSIRSDSPT